MKSPVPSLVFALFAVGCTTGGLDSQRPSSPLEWPVGIFVLEGTIQYSVSTGIGSQTTTQAYDAELSIASGERMRLKSNAGMCREPEASQIQTQLARGLRTFSCGDVGFELRPTGSTVRGRLSATVPTVRREREGCIRRSEDGKTCLEYSYNYREGSRRVTTSLRVRRKD